MAQTRGRARRVNSDSAKYPYKQDSAPTTTTGVTAITKQQAALQAKPATPGNQGWTTGRTNAALAAKRGLVLKRRKTLATRGGVGMTYSEREERRERERGGEREREIAVSRTHTLSGMARSVGSCGGSFIVYH
jgi:transposase